VAGNGDLYPAAIPLLLGRPHTHTDAYPHSDSHAEPDPYAIPDPHPFPDPDALSDAYSDPDPKPYPFTKRNTVAHPKRNTHAK
jgi:hypothetical protein